jgi:hemerythrin-like domain-containing protein
MIAESATGVLRVEHQLILRVTEALERTLDSLESGVNPDLELVSECVRFFRLFADACHHGKEEDLLFTELEASGMPRHEGPIAVMLAEHRHGRELVRRMAAALEEAGTSETAMHALKTAGWGWIDLIRSHIGKEDGVLFEIADGIITGPRCAHLCDAYRDADTCDFESRSKAELEALAERIAFRIQEPL